MILASVEPLERHHKVAFAKEAVETAVQLCKKHMSKKRLPDSALDVLDEAAALFSKQEDEATAIEPAMIAKTMAHMLGNLPSLTLEEKGLLKNLKQDLQGVIFGQDKAIETLVDALAVTKAGLKTTQKPVGSFLFSGQTGVGKTEVARQLAKALGIELLRFDMSEYMESHAVSRLIGSPPGYVGHAEGGQLTNAVEQHPHCVLLLDEIEKAHPDIFTSMLQVMDYGKLTDGKGETTDFQNVILIMTTNAGGASKALIGFAGGKNNDDIQHFFTPEFRNRLDAIVPFAPLKPETSVHILEKFLCEIEAAAAAKGITLQVSDDAKAWLLKEGFDEEMGARPLARILHEHIKKPLAGAMIFEDLPHGSTAIFAKEGDGICMRIEMEIPQEKEELSL